MGIMKVVRLSGCTQRQRELLLKRSKADVELTMPKVAGIVSDVRRNGDRALLEYNKQFDGVELGADELRVSEAEFRSALKRLGRETAKAIRDAADAIKKFHLRQLPREWTAQLAPGIKAGQIVRPLERVGVYVPSGLATYPSSLLMAAVPARVAGVENVIVCTPPDGDGKVDASVLVAANVAGVDAVFKVGGVQAIAAMAYGTKTVPKVDKIVGPGNIYVTAAKQLVSPDVDIDFAAGPSEVLIVADDSAAPEIVATDLVSQAEHDPHAAAVLVTTSEKLASEVPELAKKIMEKSPRRRVVWKALGKYSWIVVARDLKEAIEFANEYAPEHLELIVRQPRSVLNSVRNAGSIFLGPYSPVAAGDLAVGTNHILPTGGAARRRSGISVLDFVRMPTVQELSEQGLKRVAGTAERMAEVEGLPGHAKSIEVRLKKVR